MTIHNIAPTCSDERGRSEAAQVVGIIVHRIIEKSFPLNTKHPGFHQNGNPGCFVVLNQKKRQISTLAYFAFDSMKARLGGTSSPISIENIRSTSTASSMVTCLRMRVEGSMVVSHN